MWFEPTNLVAVEDRQSGRCFMLGVPTELHKFWISQNLLERICSEISALYQNPFQIELVVTGQGGVTLVDESSRKLESTAAAHDMDNPKDYNALQHRESDG